MKLDTKLNIGIDTKINCNEILDEAKLALKDIWQEFDKIKEINQEKVIEAFKKAGVQNMHYTWVTGYGYDDLGKDKLDEVYAAYFGTEAALVRPQLVSGTHAISCAVIGNLDAGDEFLAVGLPYDTLQTSFNKYSKKYNFNFKKLEEICPQLVKDDFAKVQKQLEDSITENTKLAFIQRSRGYEWRESYTLDQIEALIKVIKAKNSKTIVFVDNCYGEFTQTREPSDVGADIFAGSLIKNPGAGIVASGAYICGRQELIDNAAEFMTAPGIGAHGGCMFDQTRLMFQGFFMAPLIVSEALKGMSLAAKILGDMGYETIPAFDAPRNDIIQSIKLNNREKLIEFCTKLQAACPVNSMFSPVPDAISGYDDEIIMASGSFIEGSSIELSSDGPLREPYIAYLQGGLSWAHTAYFLKSFIR